MKILNWWTKKRRKIRLIRNKITNIINNLKKKQKLVNVVNIIRKQYITEGTTNILLQKYQTGYDIEPYLDELVKLGSISYTKDNITYEITIKEI